MYNAGSVRHGYIFVHINHECFLMLLFCRICRTFIKGLIFLEFQFFSLKCLKDLIGFFAFLCKARKHSIKESFCKNICISVCGFNLYVLLIRIYAKSDI